METNTTQYLPPNKRGGRAPIGASNQSGRFARSSTMRECALGSRLFFFSSRRRHTRSKRDWSSDVSSSDFSRWRSKRRRFERHREEARLPPGKTLDAFDFAAVPMISKAQVHALAAGDAWIEKGT